jgi:hypothetical protein
MESPTIRPGDRVTARNAFGQENDRRAITAVIAGQDFAVVWVCGEEEWQAADRDGREPEGVPFPAEDVRLAAAPQSVART